MILSQAQSACSQDARIRAPITIAAAQPAPAKDSAKADRGRGSVPAPEAGSAGTGPAARPPTPRLWADSVRKAKEVEMSRETFAYGGSARDPFNSLFNMAKSGPELADLQLVGIYQNLRYPDRQRGGVPREGRRQASQAPGRRSGRPLTAGTDP